MKLNWSVAKSGYELREGSVDRVSPFIFRGGALFIGSGGQSIVTSDGFYDYTSPPEQFLIPRNVGERRVASIEMSHLEDVSADLFSMNAVNSSNISLTEKDSGLFRTFASLESEEEIIDFATTWGPLGGDASVSARFDGHTDNAPSFWAEPLSIWIRENHSIATGEQLRELLLSGDEKAATEITDIRDEVVYVSLQPHWTDSVWERERKYGNVYKWQSSRIEEINNKGPLQAVRYALEDLIREGVRGRVNIVPASSEGFTKADVQPSSLLGLLWYQLLVATSHSIEFSQCSECGTWFEIGSRNARPDKVYCSDACRMRAYRARKKAIKK